MYKKKICRNFGGKFTETLLLELLYSVEGKERPPAAPQSGR